MICIMCNRLLLRPALLLGEHALGPKCARKLKGVKPKQRKHKPEAVTDDRTLPLF